MDLYIYFCLYLIYDASVIGETFTTNVDCGGISSGTSISSNDTVQKLVKDMVAPPEPPSPPNDQYDENGTVIATWRTRQDVDDFFEQYNYQNGWAGLKLGNKIHLISGNTFTLTIVGFNCEHNQTAADGTVYNNGYGICLLSIPLSSHKCIFGESYYLTYYDSPINKTRTSEFYYEKCSVMQDHIVNRSVLFSNSKDENNITNGSIWTKANLTSLSLCQLGFDVGTYRTIHDDGEAAYKLPILNFNSSALYTSDKYWVRNIYYSYTVYTPSGGTMNGTTTQCIRPLIYLR